MYAVMFQVESNKDWEGDLEADLDQLVGYATTLPGFVRGTWTLPDADGRALSFVVFGTEEEARSVADSPPPPGGPVILRDVQVHEIAREA
jgi:hypothetical protein